jgi:CRP-like cAMP-binding protein
MPAAAKSETLDLLSKIDFFTCLVKQDLMALARLAYVPSYAKGEVIFSEGDEADAVFIVATGTVKIVVHTSDGKELILATLGAGEVFGEMALLGSAPRSATAIAHTNVALVTIDGKDFQTLLNEQPGFCRQLLITLAERLRRANTKMESFAYLDVAGRLARYLMDLARDHGHELGNGWIMVERPTHEVMAHSIGTSRETVSRLMSDFEKRLDIVNKRSKTYLRADLLDDASLAGSRASQAAASPFS